MTSTLFVVLAASGLATAQAPATTATRAAQALPAKTAALTQSNAKAQAGCFVPVQDGKLATISKIRKNPTAAGCANPALAAGAGNSMPAKLGAGAIKSPVLPVAGGAAVAGGLIVGLSSSPKPSVSAR